MIKGVVFDLDGTLIDTASILSEAWVEALSSEGVKVEYDDIHKNTRGMASRDIVKRYLPGSSDEDVPRMNEKRKKAFMASIEIGKRILYPETMDVLAKLDSKGIKSAIGTGMSRDLLGKVLDTTRLSEKVKVVVSSDDVANGKPSPDIFEEAFKRLKVDAKEGMVVGDSVNDILPGIKIGAFTVFISRNGEKLDIADKNINSLEEIFKFI
ncbi:MAG: HAD-superfamily hydrolase, subfamily IA, variant 3 [Candidatus Parvarchaeum acidophilus ARMAN-5]|jgi:HAD superfamily hydrolase (TIGR01509 family)|uniref:HAD-superfamily hydrolase, subfamily IA, variant 3 n=1 Tax=Candidatus Parvarchaeum acidophilus ARMAN-5 TaxID=662762 RepID=D6GWK4_PARA5|nr:MAG: HAD-superfamily hydrolase, subfamily IA, variant 3 [Candidatus Parvarchaeum acidophilus ARMAN-5]